MLVRMFPPVPAKRVAFAGRNIQSGAPRGKAPGARGQSPCGPAEMDWIEWGRAEQGRPADCSNSGQGPLKRCETAIKRTVIYV